MLIFFLFLYFYKFFTPFGNHFVLLQKFFNIFRHFSCGVNFFLLDKTIFFTYLLLLLYILFENYKIFIVLHIAPYFLLVKFIYFFFIAVHEQYCWFVSYQTHFFFTYIYTHSRTPQT